MCVHLAQSLRDIPFVDWFIAFALLRNRLICMLHNKKTTHFGWFFCCMHCFSCNALGLASGRLRLPQSFFQDLGACLGSVSLADNAANHKGEEASAKGGGGAE